MYVAMSALTSRATVGPAWPPNPSLSSTVLGGPAPQRLTFIDRPGPAWPPNPSLLLANPSLLFARPLTSIGQTTHFCSATPSLLLARTLTCISPGHARPGQAGQTDSGAEFSHHRSERIFSPLGRLHVKPLGIFSPVHVKLDRAM